MGGGLSYHSISTVSPHHYLHTHTLLAIFPKTKEEGAANIFAALWRCRGGLGLGREWYTCVCVRACCLSWVHQSARQNALGFPSGRSCHQCPAAAQQRRAALHLPQQSSTVQLGRATHAAAQGDYFVFLLLKIGLSFTFMSAQPQPSLKHLWWLNFPVLGELFL